MKKALVTALFLGSMLLQGAWANDRLVGVWHSVDAKEGALPGAIVLEQSGEAKLSPQGQPALSGKWRDENGKLFLNMPPYGEATMGYALTKGQLVLTYDNGSRQTFSLTAKATKSGKNVKGAQTPQTTIPAKK